jgi:hypothetical protein
VIIQILYKQLIQVVSLEKAKWQQLLYLPRIA